jgi:hypothetical protein
MGDGLDLPGVRSFLDGASQALQEGKNVLLVVPPSLPFDILIAIQKAGGGERHWSAVESDDGASRNPLSNLQEQFQFCEDSGIPLSAALFAGSPRTRGRVFYLRPGEQSWPAWSKFITSYEPAAKQVSPSRRPVFIILLPRTFQDVLPKEDVCLCIIRWEGVVDSIDTRLHCHLAAMSLQLTHVESQLLCALAEELGLWDLQLCDMLIAGGISIAMESFGTLRKRGLELGFERLVSERDPRRLHQHGVVDLYDHVRQVHSAMCALRNEESVLRRRIWKAQLKTLLPVLEERRLSFIKRLGYRIPLPHRISDRKEITEPEDLDFGPLGYMVEHHQIKCDVELSQLILFCRDVRNALAHGNALTMRDLSMLRELQNDIDEHPFR